PGLRCGTSDELRPLGLGPTPYCAPQRRRRARRDSSRGSPSTTRSRRARWWWSSSRSSTWRRSPRPRRRRPLSVDRPAGLFRQVPAVVEAPADLVPPLDKPATARPPLDGDLDRGDATLDAGPPVREPPIRLRAPRRAPLQQHPDQHVSTRSAWLRGTADGSPLASRAL